MSAQATQEVMQGYMAALVDRGDFGRFFAPDVRWITMESGDQIIGRDAVRNFIVAFHTSAFDAHPQVVNLVTGDGTATLEARFVGRHTGDFAGVPATGTEVDVPYAVGYDIADGAITELRAYMPVQGMRAQLAEAAAAGRTSAPVAG
jgi:steroid delta-isomerase-like uncharacterized protein